MFAVGGRYPSLRQRRPQSRKAHQSSHPLPADDFACLFQVVPETWAVIRFAARSKHRANPLCECGIGLVSHARLSFALCSIATRRDLHGATQSRQGKETALLFDKGRPHLRSVLKMPTAFFRMATSSRSRAFSRFNRTSSGSFGLPLPGKGFSADWVRADFHRDSTVSLMPKSAAVARRLPRSCASLHGITLEFFGGKCVVSRS